MKIKRRIIVLIALSIILFISVIIKVGYVKINNLDISNLAYDMWSRDIPISAMRGCIYDRNGKLIVGNKLVLSVAVINKQIESVDLVSERLSYALECDIDEIKNHLNKKVSVELIKPEGKKIDEEVAKKIISMNLKGVYVVGDSKRYYPYGDTLCHTIGAVGSDNQGLTGLEYIYDDYLKGSPGELQIFTDAKGGVMQGLSNNYNPSVKGHDLYLTIDIDVQESIENIIDLNVEKYNPDDMAIISTSPKTGEILGIASYPRFELENYQEYLEVLNKNIPIFKSFEPGSTFKIMTYSAGLEEGVFDLNDSFYCKGHSIINGVRVKDWKAGGHGSGTFLNVIENSCNPGFMEIGLRLGIDKFYDYLTNFGFGKKTGIDLQGESTGIIFDKSIMTDLELATSSFGQGNSSTMIQLNMAANSCINGGILYKPYTVKMVSNSREIVLKNDPNEIRRTISKETSEKVKYALESVSARGTGRGAYIDGYRIGGKTGTSQISENGKYADGKYILSFIGFAPMDDVEASVYIEIENPKNTIQYGGVVAVAPKFIEKT